MSDAGLEFCGQRLRSHKSAMGDIRGIGVLDSDTLGLPHLNLHGVGFHLFLFAEHFGT